MNISWYIQKKLKQKAIKAVRNEHSKADVSRLLGLGENTLWDWKKQGH